MTNNNNQLIKNAETKQKNLRTTVSMLIGSENTQLVVTQAVYKYLTGHALKPGALRLPSTFQHCQQ